MQNLLLQIPIAINYQLHLKNNYSVILSAGTDLDILAKQHVRFEHHDNINLPVGQNFDTNYPVMVFNNLTFSAGVQKQLKHYVFQLKPFVSPQLKSVVYKKENVYFGVKLNVLLTTEK